MAVYDWYNVFSKTEFEATGLVARTYTFELEGVGQKDILVTKGNTVAMQYEDAFLPVSFLGRNPYEQGAYAVYIDSDQNVYLGLYNEEASEDE